MVQVQAGHPAPAPKKCPRAQENSELKFEHFPGRPWPISTPAPSGHVSPAKHGLLWHDHPAHLSERDICENVIIGAQG